MALADLPDGFVTFTRDQLIDKYKRDVLLRNPAADVVSGQPDLDARLQADLVLPIYSNAVLIANGINEDSATGTRLDLVGNRIGVLRGLGGGATGFVQVSCAPGGGNVKTGDELENPQTRKKYQSTETKHVDDGTHVRVRASAVGADTNVDAGTVLRWTAPRPGVGQNAVVVEQSGGLGLSGGAEPQDDPRYLDAIRSRKQNPAGGDNDAELVAIILATPDVPVEQVFTYPGMFGPGSSGFTFTVLAPSLGASRIPTLAQLQTAFEWMVSQLPGDGSYFPLLPAAQSLTLAFSVSWASGGWADATPWPPAYANNVNVFGAGGPLSFTLLGGGGTPTPVVGNTLAFWDNGAGLFRQKTISAVTGTNPWNITCTSVNAASDTTYSPFVNQLVAPWSDNLATPGPDGIPAIPESILSYLATLGPGECFTLLGSFQEGRRRRRTPNAPKSWPITVGNRVTVALSDNASVADAANLAGVGVTVSPAVPPNMLQLADLALYPG